MEQAQSVGKLEFSSPINLEGSWGTRPLADKAQSTMELFLYAEDNTAGFIEWICDQLDIVENIGLTFEIGARGKRTLTDYDGVMTLPNEAMDLLEKHGVDCKEMRRSLAD